MWDIISKMARSVSTAFEREIMEQSGLAVLKEKVSSMSANVGKVFFQFSRIIDIENEPDDTRDPVTNEYTIEYQKFQVVLANLIGPDRVLDGQHPAIVWASSKKDATVIVIPLTSKKGTAFSYYDLGIISELILDATAGPKESVVVMNQMHTVPRKAIKVLTKLDGVTPVSLDINLQNKVMDLYVRKYLNREHDLQHVLQKVVKRVPPIDAGKTDWTNDLKRPVVYIFKNKVLHYMLSDETWKSISVMSLPIPYGSQRQIIENLTSTTISVRTQAIQHVQSILSSAQVAPTNPPATQSTVTTGTP